MKISIAIWSFVAFMFPGATAFAGGNPSSVAFVFCGDFETEENFGNEVNKFLDDIKDQFGQYHLIERFQMWTHSSPIGTATHFESSLYPGWHYSRESYEDTLESLDQKCPEGIGSAKTELADAIYEWVNRSDNDFYQGSIFIAVPKSKFSEEYIENLQFPYEYKYRKVKEIGDWIVIYSTKSRFQPGTIRWGTAIVVLTVIFVVLAKTRKKF